MNTPNSNSSNNPAPGRRLPVEWLERPDALRPVHLLQRKETTRIKTHICPSQPCVRRRNFRAFTVLELIIVLAIIGFMASVALPHLKGFTQGSTMSAATRQLLDDVALARQRAIANHSEVDMVFLQPDFWISNNFNMIPQWQSTGQSNVQMSSLVLHQCGAYALISGRTVGDQPGQSYPHYIQDWHYLPQGVYISFYQLTNNTPVPTYGPLYVSTTNTMTGITNGFNVTAFGIGYFPFPSVNNYGSTTNGLTNALPYIAFGSSGSLLTNGDAYILLQTGSMMFPMQPNGLPAFSPPNFVEIPPGNTTNNANLIHIDCTTARAKLERNQF